MIIFYQGQDIYRLRTAVAALRTRLTDTHPTLTSSEPFDVSEEEGLTALEHALKYPSLFQQTSFLVVRNALADAETAQSFQKLVQSYDVANATDTFLVVCQEGPAGRPSAATKTLMAYLGTHASEHTVFEALEGPALTAWILEFCTAYGCRITTEAIALLAQKKAGDSWALAMELSKLCGFSHADGGTIDPVAVRQLVATPREEDEWELSNALSRMDKRGVIVALFKKLSEGISEQMLLGSLAASIRTLMSVRDLAERNMSPAGIAQATGLHPYVISKSLAGARASDPARLRQTHASLARMDRQSKDGTADATDALFSLVLTL